MDWHLGHHRPMPWKGLSDPYRIWLSEIILQQTRMEQGLPYYEKFVSAYPDVRALADAPLDEVLKLWEGLGYYTRARNLHATARHVAYERDGVFPEDYEGLRALRGVGDYTAAAIASFAYNLPHAVLDGNVFRVLARFWGVATPIDRPAAKKEFSGLAQQALDPENPGGFNQAIMDFGANLCTPRQPACGLCPLREQCTALANEEVGTLPAKSKTAVRKERFFAYGVFYHRDAVWVRQRTEKDIWQNLFEFPKLELPAVPADSSELPDRLLAQYFPKGAPKGAVLRGISKTYRQLLSHQVISAVFCEFDLPEEFEVADFQENNKSDYRRIEHFKLKKILALPRIIDRFWQEKDVTLRFN